MCNVVSYLPLNGIGCDSFIKNAVVSFLMVIRYTFDVSAHVLHYHFDFTVCSWILSSTLHAGLLFFAESQLFTVLLSNCPIVIQFSHIWKQTADWIELKLSRCIHFVTPQAWLTFGLVLFQVSDWLSSFCKVINKLLIELTLNLIDSLIMGPSVLIKFQSY